LLAPATPVHVVVNRAPGDGFTRAEISAEIVRTYPPASLHFVPEDAKVAAAAWLGALVATGGFTRAIERLATEVLPVATSASAPGQATLGPVRFRRRRVA
jgi:hypothetical protein